MAKVPFNKLKCKINEDSIPVKIGEETIAVRQYLPVQEKLALIGRVVEFAHDADRNFSNPVKADIFKELELVFAYTNIAFTDKQKEDIPKLYDMLASSGVLAQILEAIPEEERTTISYGVIDSVEAIYKYQNSVLGLLDIIATDYSALDLDITKIQDKIKNPENLTLLKDIITKLG